MKKNLLKLALFLILFGLLLAALLPFKAEVIEEVARLSNRAKILSSLNPVYLVVSIALLPLVFVPTTPFYVVAGIAYGPIYGPLYALIGLSINILLCFLVGQTFLKNVIKNFLAKRKVVLPEIPPSNFIKLVIGTRLIPTVPLGAQNYFLTLMRVPMFIYLMFSIPTHFIWALIYSITGGAILKSNIGIIVLLLITAAALMFLFTSLAGLVRKK